ncbi:MAG: Flp pilus assembly protein CpaB [Negativicutes bacterium]|nr:Flp pilus assembly protein CpaB [Negativicutes bacterium]
MAKLSSKALLGVAVFLSLITSILVYNYLQNATQQTAKASLPVVVAKVDIPPKTAVTPDMIRVMNVPEEYLQPGAVREQQLVVGITTREHIVAGEQITERRLVLQGKSAGFSGIIPKDKRAITVAVTDVTGVAGFIKPGDYVDVLATFDQNAAGDNVSHLILQNILVLAFNHDTEAGVANPADKERKEAAGVKHSTVTLAVTPDEAAKITLTEEKGKLRLALRPYTPAQSIAITSAVTPRDVVGEHAPVNKESATPASPAPQPSKPEAGGKGIVVIRGAKMETIPVN